MAKKKDRSRFSIKFNENDPAHETVICLLEKQGPHSKASFIVNAILHYMHCPETPDIPHIMSVQPISITEQAAVIDKAAIEAIVLEILSRQQDKKELISEIKHDIPRQKTVPEVEEQEHKWIPNKMAKSEDTNVDDEMRTLIASTMSAFRNV